MVDEGAQIGRVCREVRVHLPAYVAGHLPRLRRRLVGLHLRRCTGCQVQLARQQEIAAGLQELATELVAEPPEGLLDAILERAEQPDARGRAAVPARGAVSGARPALSVALLVGGAATGTAVGYAAWRGARAVRGRGSRR